MDTLRRRHRSRPNLWPRIVSRERVPGGWLAGIQLPPHPDGRARPIIYRLELYGHVVMPTEYMLVVTGRDRGIPEGAMARIELRAAVYRAQLAASVDEHSGAPPTELAAGWRDYHVEAMAAYVERDDALFVRHDLSRELILSLEPAIDPFGRGNVRPTFVDWRWEWGA